MKRTKKGAFTLLLTLCVALGLLPALTPAASAADNVTYLDASGATQTAASATSVTSDDTAWSGTTDNPGWYVVDSTLENTNHITVTGDVRLILKDSAELTASAGIIVTGSNKLTIYAQSTDAATMGKLSATGTDGGAGIGGNEQSGGAVTINGGAVTANGASKGAGIGGGNNGAGGTIIINGGTVTATGGNDGAGIGGGYNGAGGTITVNGGTVTAKGGVRGAGIGGGHNGAGGNVTINGGSVTANGGSGAAGIGGGRSGAGGNITINGGAVTATGRTAGAGIGGGYKGACGNITINGGTVEANGNDGGGTSSSGAGIGGGESGNNSGGSISITGGTVTATVTAGKGAAIGDGGGTSSSGAPVTIDDGLTVVAGTKADGSDATTVTDVANKTNYKYARIFFPIAVTGVTLDQSILNLTVGGSTATLTPIFGPVNATETTVTWASSDTAVATVSNGVVTPVAVGTATITVTATNGTDDTSDDKTATCAVTVVPSYAVTAADTITATDKKYHYGDEFTIAVTVSGADFEGGEFTLKYDSATLEVKTLPANNKFTESDQTAETVKFEALNKAPITGGQPLATITFTVKTKVTTKTTCNFTFEGTPKVCYDTNKDSVEAATVTTGSVTVEPITYTVTLTGENGVTFLKGSETITTDTAIDGQDYSVTIGEYSATDYEYAVTLAVEGTTGTTTLTPDTNGVITVGKDNITGNLTVTVTRTTKHVTATLEGGLLSGSTDAIKGVDYTATISDYDANNYTYAVTLTMNNASADDKATMSGGTITIDGDDITGDFTLTVTKTLANFTVTTTADYVTGWTLVTVAKASGHTDNPVYNYDGNAAYYVEAYNAYAYLVEGEVTEDDAKAKVSLGTSAAGTIATSEQYDVNNTGKVDYSDALLTYRCYEMVYQTPATAMETYLRADADGSKKVDTTDVSAIDGNRTAESA